MITWEVILVFSSLKILNFWSKNPCRKAIGFLRSIFSNLKKKHVFFKNFINKFRRKLTRLKSLFSSLKIFSRPCVRILRFFPATHFVVSILTKNSAFSLLVSHGIKMLKIVFYKSNIQTNVICHGNLVVVESPSNSHEGLKLLFLVRKQIKFN